MQLGFYTTVLGEQPIEEVAFWAAEAGFDTLEVDVTRHVGDPTRVRHVVEMVRRAGVDVCTLTLFGNLLAADLREREQVRTMLHAVVDGAAEAGVKMVCAFPGRDETASEDDNYRQLAAYYGPLVERAATGHVTMLLENWPGPHVNYVATTPAGWERLFTLVPASTLGLNFDPSHLIWQGIDPEQALRVVADRVFMAHAKDTQIFAERRQKTGYYGVGWWTYRLPGHGSLDWQRWLRLLRGVGFDGVVSVEHEDSEWGWPGGNVEHRRAGLREALRVLREAIPLG